MSDRTWISEMRQTLETLDGALGAAREIAEKRKQQQKYPADRAQAIGVLDQMAWVSAEASLRAVYASSESPIERLFWASLVLGFVMVDPLGAIFTGPITDAPETVRRERQFATAVRKVRQEYEQSGFAGRFDEWLSQRSPSLEAASVDYLTTQYLADDIVGLDKIWRLTPQAGFPDLKIDGRSVRVDLLAWKALGSTRMYVVECDGFDYHSDRSAFARDRKRDRALRSLGFPVLRYSGSEIHGDPVETAMDLYATLSGRKGRPKR
jgi:hypothetical protein